MPQYPNSNYRGNNYKPNYNPRRQKSTEVEIVETLFKGLWWLITLPFKALIKKKNQAANRHGQNISSAVNAYDPNWVDVKQNEIVQLMSLGSPSNFSKAVLEADKLLDYCLKGQNVFGETMGERLKNARNLFSYEGYNAAWQGHKIRNEIVHNSEFEVTDFVARHAIENFKKAMRELK